ncbi:MAG: hypothetical protein SPH68_06520 [Candidatus Borkfalkiaceae bacterium]|nr:hypothetical protein [Clostridia bacterium]MDY6223792.1 hypothetical protein [Christensenellaceae bacterium]
MKSTTFCHGNSFINRVILYDDRVLIFYNTDANRPTVVKREENEEIIAESDDLADVTSAKTKKNSLEPKKFKRVSLGGNESRDAELYAFQEEAKYLLALPLC